MKKNMLYVVLLVVMVGVFVFLYHSSQDIKSSSLEYKNQDIGFRLSYPSLYHEEQDISGWPHAVLLLDKCKGCSQSYDIAVESWDSEADWQKYEQMKIDPVLVVKVKDVYITISYQNDVKVDAEKIAESFTLLDKKETSSQMVWKRK